MEDDLKIKAMAKAMGEPFGMEYQEDVLKTRRNLLLASSTSVLIWAGGLRLKEGGDSGPTAPYLGFPLTGMTHELLLWALVVSIVYLLFHFIWGSLDAISEYRLRSTGARVSFQTGARYGSDGIDAPIHPRQATLYSWWVQSAQRFEKDAARLDVQMARLQEFDSALQHAIAEGLANMDTTEVRDLAKGVLEEHKGLKSHIEQVGAVLGNERHAASLQRFDDAFRARALSQNARWLVLEFGLPVALGIYGLFVTFAQLYPRWWVICGHG